MPRSKRQHGRKKLKHAFILSTSCSKELHDKVDAIVEVLLKDDPLATRSRFIRDLITREADKYSFRDEASKSIEDILGV